MNQLPIPISIRVVSDNQHLSFLKKMIALYNYYPKFRTPTLKNKVAERCVGYKCVPDQHGKLRANPYSFEVDAEGRILGMRPTGECYIFGLPAERLDQIMNFQFVKSVSNFNLEYYEIEPKVDGGKHLKYLTPREEEK